MLVHSNEDGTYSANWTPGSVGFYNIQVTIDGIEAGKSRLLVNLGSENMLVHSNEDGTYSANSTPGSVGFYKIQVTTDGIEAGKSRLLNNLGSDSILLVFPRVKASNKHFMPLKHQD